MSNRQLGNLEDKIYVEHNRTYVTYIIILNFEEVKDNIETEFKQKQTIVLDYSFLCKKHVC